MAFEKGNKLSKGRTKGSQNKTTQEVRELLESNRTDLVQRALDLVLVKDLEKTNVTMLSKLLDKIIPTLQQTEWKGILEHKKPSEMSDAELHRIAKGSSNRDTSTETRPN